MSLDALDAVFRRLDALEKHNRALRRRLVILLLLAVAALGLAGYLLTRVVAADAARAKLEQDAAQHVPDEGEEPEPTPPPVLEAAKLVLKTPEGQVYATLDQGGLTLFHATGKYAARLSRPLVGQDPALEMWDANGRRRAQLALFGENGWLELTDPQGKSTVRLSAGDKAGPGVRLIGGRAERASIALQLLQDMPALTLAEQGTRSSVTFQVLESGPNLILRDGRGDGLVNLGVLSQQPVLSLRGGGKVLNLPSEK